MNRMTVAIPAGLIAGAFVGLMIGGLWLQWQLGANINAGHPFVLVTDFPGLRAVRQDPWRTAYLIVLAGALVLALVALVFSFSHRLTTYGKSHFQTRREVRKNGLLQPVGSGLVFGKFGKPKTKGSFVSGTYDQFPHALIAAPTRSGSYAGFWVIRPDQAARFSATLVATPSVNVTPSMSKGNWFAPFRRRHVLAAA